MNSCDKQYELVYDPHKHPGIYSGCLRVDFAICQAIFGLSPVTALDSDLSEHLRKIDLRKNSTSLKFGINRRISSYGLNNHIRTGFEACTQGFLSFWTPSKFQSFEFSIMVRPKS